MMKRLLDRMKRISVRTYLIIMAGIILPMFTASALLRYQYEQYIQDELSQQIISSISKSEEALYQSFRNMAGISSAVVTNTPLMEGLRRDDAATYEIGQLFDECVNYIRINNLYASDDLMLTLFDRQQRCFTNWEQNFHDYTFLLKEDWVSRAYEEKGHLVWNLFSPAFVSGASDQQKYVSVARAIPNVSAGADFLGMLIVSMPQDHLSQVLSSYCYAEGDSVFMLGDSGDAILQYAPEGGITAEELSRAFSTASTAKSGSMRMQTAAGTKLVSYYTLDAPWNMGETTLRIIHFTDFQAVLSKMAQFSSRMNLIAGLVLAAFALVTALIVGHLVAPVRRLAHTMGHYRLGDSLDDLDMDRQDEIGHLNRSFRRLTANIQDLFRNLNEEYRVKEKYRYESLRAQLNPHFLFNTLNTLRCMAIMQHAGSITEGIDSLGTVLKYAMSRDGDLASLRDEIDHVKSYVAIQNMRFGRQIRVEEDFDPGTTELTVLRFILQPMVENAIIHGFRDSAGQAEKLIRLYGGTEDGHLDLYVEDNGAGMQTEEIERLNTGEGRKEKLTGIGFSNVREMIALSFGSPYTVTVSSTPGVGTVVHFILPVLNKSEGGAALEADHGRG